ncbi:MAG: hypothetical protein GWM93_21505 [Gemmatimonadetes bacterium]|uniref:site-specific DNA-methyltransferase (adenine-specific) n=1 Tax=Candidatus Kutchimonas denitrificans TaxID=3056748 RepID=A0AAE4ZDJ6_9BACT|nr:hypothetical protein [Candidatus Kutchimonas denitrificans]NIT69219.1 hypothetical protein [Gemmatimonadota bacterium]NIU54611.1 hypothetical protein [Gemmatimonadota bacterium]NIY37796.1 hypothetical protein [Gemmatimonadota bacterium]
MLDTAELHDALSKWRSEPERLLSALGFEPMRLPVARPGLADFGLDPDDPVALEVMARRGSFVVLRAVLADGLDPEAIVRVARALYRHNPARRALLALEAPDDSRLVLASWGLGPGPFRLSKLWIDLEAPRPSELDILAELATDGGTATELALAHSRALDREGITQRFFVEFRRCRADLAEGLVGLSEDSEQDRLDLALVLLTRLLFLYFIQRKGWLAGNRAYLRDLYHRALDAGIPFYRRRLKSLFFGALNRPAARRSKTARGLGELPYLNGGLFERDPLERKHPRLDVPNECFAPVFDDLLDRYQFTLRQDQARDQDVAVDPEMLGKVFEGLMAGSTRSATGAFFTPRSLVDALVIGALAAYLSRRAGCDPVKVECILESELDTDLDDDLRARLLESLRAVRVLDPAVGSGAFLLSALHTIETLHDELEGAPADPFARLERRQELIRSCLYGVDINAAAVRLCELRLWLALIVDLEVDRIADVPPLPNLDINIRQGDALIDPIDFLIQLADLDGGALAGRTKRGFDRLKKRRAGYFHASGPSKRRSARALRRAERDLALEFLGELSGQIDARRDELRAAAGSRNLFGRRSGLTREQKKAAAALKRRKRQLYRLIGRVGQLEELPFFSFSIHFPSPDGPGAPFPVIVGNPPWVRTHHWSGLSRERLKERFRFLKDAGWRSGARMAGTGRGFGAQLDLSALFLERSLELLGEDGALGFLLPAKLVRSLSAGALRRRLLGHTRILQLEDCALATARPFEATTYPLGLVLGRGTPEPNHDVYIYFHDRLGQRTDFWLPQSELPLIGEDPESPWVLAPGDVRATFDAMRQAGPALGARPERRPHRGIFTGGNSVFVGRIIGHSTEANLARIRLGDSTVELETERLRPVLRGEDLRAWRFDIERALVWTHGPQGHPLPVLPPATASYLTGYERLLASRGDLRSGQPWWTLFRVRPHAKHRVVWRDIAPAPGAAVLPARTRFLDGHAPIICLNTVYQISAASGEDAHFLAGVLNSTVARAYLKAIAERASGGYFRFLGWTVALLPLPTRPDAAVRSAIIELSRAAHVERRMAPQYTDRLDRLVCRLYGLGPADLISLTEFDIWTSNRDGR